MNVRPTVSLILYIYLEKGQNYLAHLIDVDLLVVVVVNDLEVVEEILTAEPAARALGVVVPRHRRHLRPAARTPVIQDLV